MENDSSESTSLGEGSRGGKRYRVGDDATSDKRRRTDSSSLATETTQPSAQPGPRPAAGQNIYVLSHGTSYTNCEVKIPDGVEVHLYTDVDSYTLRSNGLAILNAGSGFGSRKAYRQKMRGIRLTRFSDFELIQHLASPSAATDGQVYVVGADVHEVLRKATPKRPIAQEIKPLPDGLGLAQVFALLAGEIAGEARIHFVACRPEVGRWRDMPTTVSLGSEETPANERATLQNVTDLEYAPDDMRHIVQLVRKYKKMRSMGSDYATFLTEFESLPQATQAALVGLGLTAQSEWRGVSRKEWPVSKDDPTSWQYTPLWGKLGHPPATLDEAWLVHGWRNLFWNYMHGPKQADHVARSRLMLWIAIKKYFNATSFPTDTGRTLSAPEVLDSHILDLLTGSGESSGTYPAIDHTALQESVRQVANFDVAASFPESSRERALALRSFEHNDLQLLQQFSGDVTVAHHEARARHVAVMRDLEAVVGAHMNEWWEHFRRFIYERWAQQGINPA